MQDLEVTWPRAIKVWWSFVWRATLIAVIAGVVIGLVLAIIQLATGTESNIAGLLGALLGIPAGMLAMKLTLGLTYSDFRLALVPLEENESGVGPPQLPVTTRVFLEIPRYPALNPRFCTRKRALR